MSWEDICFGLFFVIFGGYFLALCAIQLGSHFILGDYFFNGQESMNLIAIGSLSLLFLFPLIVCSFQKKELKNVSERNDISLIFAYDPKVKRRVVYKLKGNVAVSIVSGHSFKLTKKEIEYILKQRKKERGK